MTDDSVRFDVHETPPPITAAEIAAQIAAGADDLLRDWIGRAKIAEAATARQELWPAWSKGELLAAAVIVGDNEMLTHLGYTREEAIERLRHDLGMTSTEAVRVFAAAMWEVAGG